MANKKRWTLVDAFQKIFDESTSRIRVDASVTGGLANKPIHRSNITTVDKLIDFADASVTIADNGVGTGSLVASTAYYATAVAGNKYGICKVNANIDTLTTAAYGANTGSLRMTIAQCVSAEYYDIFLGTLTAPSWVGRITEAQRAAGGYEVTAVGTIASGSGSPAGKIDINVGGNGVQTTNAMFGINNAYTPDMVTAIDCTGKTKAYVYTKMSVTDLRSAPALTIVPFLLDGTSGEYFQGTSQQVAVLSGSGGQSLYQVFVVDVDSTAGLKILIGTIAGQGASASIYVGLV